MKINLILNTALPQVSIARLPASLGERHREIDIVLGRHTQESIIKPSPRRWLKDLTMKREPVQLYYNRLAQCSEALDGTIVNGQIDQTKLRLGPLVGIFVSRGMLKGIKQGNPSFRIWETIKANENEDNIPYYFTFDCVDFTNNSILGYYFNVKKAKWMESMFPFPDVIWDRGGGFTHKQSPTVKALRQKLYALPIPRINPMYHFSKWELYKRLSHYPGVKNHLPLTRLYAGAVSLIRMLKLHRNIYVKDVYGANGRSVMNLRLSRRGIMYRAFRYQEVSGRCSSITELLSVFNSFFHSGATLIMQKTVKVVRRNGRSIDLRALAQRDADGTWKLTSMPIRLGAPNCPITSTSSGSQVFSFEAGVTDVLGYTREEGSVLRTRLEACLWEIVMAVEQEYGQCGELGVDLAVDQQGKIWFYECNAKPGKDTVMMTKDLETVNHAFARPLRYARYLAGWTGD